MKMHHESITIQAMVPDGYHVSKVTAEQLITVALESVDVDFGVMSDAIIAKITITKDIE